MIDRRYSEPSEVSGSHRRIFEQLASAFPAYEVWERWQDYGRWLSAGVVNRDTAVAVTIPLVHAGRSRTAPITPGELETIRSHLASAGADLTM